MSKKNNIEIVKKLWLDNKNPYHIHLTTGLPFGEITAIIENCNDAKAKHREQLRANKVSVEIPY